MKHRGVLLTGFPSNELARRVLMRLLESQCDTQLTCLVPERFFERAEAWLGTRSAEERERVQLLEGDVAAVDLGLSGAEYSDLLGRIGTLHHCAAVTYTGAPLKMAENVNVGGTYEVLEFGRSARQLDRIVHWSSLAATWDVEGVLREDVLVPPRAGRLADTRYRAEKLIAKAREEVPITVLRPAMLVGDSRTGELGRIEGAHLLISHLLAAPRDVPMPHVGRSDAPFCVVPIDYAVDAGLAIARANDTVGRTFHIVDAAPPSMGQALGAIAEILGRPAPRGELPHPVASFLLRLPVVDRLVHAQRALVEELGREVRYDDANARPVLSRAGMSCPPLLSYLHKLVDHVARERNVDRSQPTVSPNTF